MELPSFPQLPKVPRKNIDTPLFYGVFGLTCKSLIDDAPIMLSSFEYYSPSDAPELVRDMAIKKVLELLVGLGHDEAYLFSLLTLEKKTIDGLVMDLIADIEGYSVSVTFSNDVFPQLVKIEPFIDFELIRWMDKEHNNGLYKFLIKGCHSSPFDALEGEAVILDDGKNGMSIYIKDIDTLTLIRKHHIDTSDMLYCLEEGKNSFETYIPVAEYIELFQDNFGKGKIPSISIEAPVKDGVPLSSLGYKDSFINALKKAEFGSISAPFIVGGENKRGDGYAWCYSQKKKIKYLSQRFAYTF